MSDHPQTLAVIDQGSTATKGAVATADGRLLFSTEAAVERRSEGERVEHDPSQLLASVRSVLERCRERHAVDAVGLTCQRSTCLFWERDGAEPLTPAISWQDRREAARVDALGAHGREIERRTGLRLSPHYAAPKLLGLLERSPKLRRRAESGEVVGGTLDAFLIHHLAGQPLTDPTHAGRTLLYNLQDDAWDEALCAMWNLPTAMLPVLLPSRAARGEVDGTPINASVGDQQAALLGHGGWSAGVTAVHFGTGAFVLTGTGSSERRHPGLLTAVLASTANERRFQLEGSINSAGSAVDIVCQRGALDLDTWQDRMLDDITAPMVLPAFAGLAAPWWRPDLEALLPPGALASEPEALLAGVLGALAQRVADITEAMAAAGTEISILRASGRLTRLSGLVQRIADLTRTDVEVAEEESGLIGVARLAAGRLESAPPTTPSQTFEPRWPPTRTTAERQRWKAFVAEMLAE